MPPYTLKPGVLAVIASGVLLERDPATGAAPTVEVTDAQAREYADALEPATTGKASGKTATKPKGGE